MRVDTSLFYATTILICIGIVFSLSLSAYTVLLFNTDHLHFFIRQLIVGILCIFMMWAISFIKSDKFFVYFGNGLFLIFLIIILFMNVLPENLVMEVNGAARWIKFPLFSIAPVEFFKVGFICFLAWSFDKKISGSKDKPLVSQILLLLPYLIPFIGIIIIVGVVQNDLGQVMVLCLVMIMMLLFAGTSMKLLGMGFVGVFTLGVIFIITSEHRIERFMSWWGGVQDIVLKFVSPQMATRLHVEGASAPYQVSHSLNAINNGGFFGQGIGEGSFKLGFLSEVHTDFVLAGITEEIGFIGITCIVLLFLFILYHIFHIASLFREKNNTYYLFSVGIGFMLLFSFIINAYGITSILPVKGIAVPFLSYGGSHVMAASLAIALVLMISKKA